MGRTLKQKLRRLPKARRAGIEARASELIGQQLSLRDLRKALDHTQVEIASRMGVGQDTVSRYEQRTDMMLSTMERYVSAMGGTLALIAEFPGRDPLRIRSLGELSKRRPRAPAEGAAGRRGKRVSRR